MTFFRRFALWGRQDASGRKDDGAQPLHLLALEPRIVYDAAGVATVAQDDGAHRDAAAPDPLHDTHPAESFEAGLNRTLTAFRAFAAPAADFPPSREPAIAAPFEAPPAAPTAILFVDSRVEDYRQLTGGLGADVKVVVLHPEEDGINQITRELALHDNLDAVHIVSHGESGSITLGSAELSRETLDARPEHFRLWGTALADQADLLLYGCDVAEGVRGVSFIEHLSQLTKADVAASTDTTGAAELGGDWDLEGRTGTIEAGVFAGNAVQAEWKGTLDEVTLASVDSGGNQHSNGTFWYTAKTSDDGRFVVFSSNATDLVAGDTNGFTDVFVHDRETGQTTRVSVDTLGNQATGGESYLPDISPDGRFIVYQSYATNLDLVTPDTNGELDIYFHDRLTGETSRVSVDSIGNQANGSSYTKAISADGRYIAFVSGASNLVAGDTNAELDVFVHDRQSGQTTRVSVDSGGNQGNGWNGNVSISADGRFVVFKSGATNLVANDTNGTFDIFMHDRQTAQTTRVSVDSNGNESDGYCSTPAISSDGRFIAFESMGTNLVAGDTNGFCDVFVHDRVTGKTTRVSVDSNGNEANGDSLEGYTAISNDGKYVTFLSDASNLVAGDTNGVEDLFIHNLIDGKTVKVSSLIDGLVASGAIYINNSAGQLTLLTNASLVGADVNGLKDVYVIDLNDAPVVNASGKASVNAIMEDSGPGNGTAVGDIVGPVFDDVDGKEGLGQLAVPGMAVTGVDNANGTWEYSVDYGASWTPFAGLSNVTATLLSGEVRMTSAPITDTTDIAAADLLINGEATAAIVLNRPLQYGLNMEGAWNLMEEVNNLDVKVMADVATLYCSNVAATLGGSTDVDFYLNGQLITFTTSGASVAQVLNDTITAINAESDLTGVTAYAGNGTNGGAADAIVLINVEPGNKSPISITDYTETGTAATGLNNVFQLADPTHNTAEITFFSLGRFLVSTTGGSDAILNQIGLGGGSAVTGQPGDTAADGKILVSTGPDRIRFVPNISFSGTADITFKLWDGSDPDLKSGDTGVDVTGGGGASAFSTSSTFAEIRVNPLAPEMLAPDGLEFQVTTTTADNQATPVVATLGNGDFVIVWQSNLQDGSGNGVYGRIFSSGGTPLTGEFQLNQTSGGEQFQPSVIGTGDGGFFVAWSSDQDAGEGYNVYGRKFDGTGTPLGGEFRVNTTTVLDQYLKNEVEKPLAALADGSFLVTWKSFGQDGSGVGVYAQRYDVNANPIGVEFLVNETTALDQDAQSVTAFPNGGFMVAWMSFAQDGDQGGIYRSGFNRFGELIGGETQVNTTTADHQQDPCIVALNDGGFVVTWTSTGQDTSLDGIFARRFNSLGAPVGGEFQVNTTVADDQWYPVATALEDGGFVIVWQSNLQDGSGFGIFGQRYDANGAVLGGEFQVNVVTDNGQITPSVAGLPGGGFVVAWNSNLQDGSGNGIFAQRFDINAAPVLDNTGSPTLIPINESYSTSYGTLVSDLVSGIVTDANNNGLLGLAVTGSDETNGLWQYTLDNSGTWQNVGVVSDASALLLAADTDTRIRFLADPGFTGSASFDFRAWDRSFGASGQHEAVTLTADSAFSTAVESASISVAPLAADTPDKIGGEFLVNTNNAVNGDYQDVAALENGGFVAVWARENDGDNYGIAGQRYDSSGTPTGVEFLINTTTTDQQMEPAAAGLADGGFVVTWTSNLQDGSGVGVFGQRFDAAGNAVGGEFQVNVYTTSHQKESAVVGMDDGGFYVVWTSDGPDGSGYSIMGRRYDSSGNPTGGESLINTYSVSSQMEPAVTKLADGSLVVSWSSFDVDGDEMGICVRRLDAAGTPTSAEMVVNTFTTWIQAAPTVTALRDGGFVVTWYSYLQDGGSSGIYGQRFADDGTPVAGEFHIDSYNQSDQFFSSVAATDSGGFVVFWRSNYQDGSSSAIFGQNFDAGGNKRGSEFQVNATTSGWQTGVKADTLKDGKVVAVWRTAWDIYGQVLGVNQAPVLTGDANLAAIAEDATTPTGDSVANLFNALFSDGDALNSLYGIAVVGNLADAGTEGQWEYSSDGTHWNAIGSVDDAANALVLYTTDKVRFVPVADYAGSPPALQVRALDNTYTGSFSGTNPVESRVLLDVNVTGGTTPISAVIRSIQTTVNAVNDAPVFIAGAVSSYMVDDPAVAVDSGIALTDVDNVNLQGATITISAGYAAGADVLSCTPAGALTASWDAASATLTVTGAGTVAEYQATLGSVLFASLGGAAPAGARTVSFQAYDGALTSVVATTTVNVSVAPPPPLPPPVVSPPVEPPPVEPPPVDPPPVEPPPVEPPPEPPPVEPPPVEPPPAASPPPPPPPPPDSGAGKTEPALAEPLTPAASLLQFQPTDSSGTGLMAGAGGTEADAGAGGMFSPGFESLPGADALAFFSDTAPADPFALAETPAGEAAATGEGTGAADAAAPRPGEAAELPGQEGEQAPGELKEPAVDEEAAVEEAAAEEAAEAKEEAVEAGAAAPAGEAAETPAAKGTAKDQKAAGKPAELQKPAETDKAQAERAEILKVFDEVYKLTQCN